MDTDFEIIFKTSQTLGSELPMRGPNITVMKYETRRYAFSKIILPDQLN
jgi:hypothetical protein